MLWSDGKTFADVDTTSITCISRSLRNPKLVESSLRLRDDDTTKTSREEHIQVEALIREAVLPAEVPLSIDRTELIRSRWLRDQRLTWSIVYVAISITLDALASVDVTELTTFTQTEATLDDILQVKDLVCDRIRDTRSQLEDLITVSRSSNIRAVLKATKLLIEAKRHFETTVADITSLYIELLIARTWIKVGLQELVERIC